MDVILPRAEAEPSHTESGTRHTGQPDAGCLLRQLSLYPQFQVSNSQQITSSLTAENKTRAGLTTGFVSIPTCLYTLGN